MASNSWAKPKVRHLPRTLVALVGLVVIFLWLVNTPGGLLGKADAIGYAVCHRIDLRSFHLGTRPLPLCSRCSGMYLGALGTFALFLLRRPRAGRYPSRKVNLVLGLFGLFWLVDGLNSFAHFFPEAPHLYQPSNVLRLITGTAFGVSVATMIYPVFSQSVWREWKDERVMDARTDYAMVALIAGAVVVAILSENPLVLYPLALVSSLGVLMILSVAYTILILSVRGKLNQASKWRDLIPTMIGGLTVAFIQIGLIDLGRYFLTGTWDGFHF